LVSYLLIIAAITLSATAFAEPTRQICLSCHPSHFAERGICTGCHRGNAGSERKNIAHLGLVAGKYARYTLGDKRYLGSGNRLLDQFSCRRCHIIDGRGNRLAINLDASAARKTPEEIADAIRRPVDNMPDFALAEEQRVFQVNAILAGSQTHKGEINTPVSVHFNIAKERGEADVFTLKCGSCHRLLSESRWGVGSGNVAPNLSGLFSIHYPKSFKGSDSWTFQNLKSWLNNPRELKSLATMRPVKMTDEELKELEAVLRVNIIPQK